MKYGPSVFSALAGLIGLVAMEARADNFVTITPTGASAATVANRWTIASGQAGLSYDDSNSGFPGATATNFFTITGAAIPPGGSSTGFTSYLPVGTATAQASVGNSLTANSYAGLTYASNDLGFGALSFYAIHHSGTGDYLALIKPGAPTATDFKALPLPGDPLTPGGSGYFALSYAADNPGAWGANLFYYLRNDPVTGHTWFGTMIPALGSGPIDHFDLGLAATRGFTDLAYTSTNVGFGFGASQFYYLRLDPVTQTTFFGRLDPLTGTATDIQDLGGTYRTLVFTTTAVGFGTNNFYSIGWAAQTITFAAIPAHTACDAPFTFVLPTANSGLPVTLVVTSGPATVAGNTVTLTGGTGTVVLTASQAGDSNFMPAANVAQSFVVSACVVPPTSQTISFASIPTHTACDAPFTFVLPSATSGLPVALTVTGPATISGNTVTLTGAVGTVVLTATQAGNGTFSAAPTVVQNIAVTACVVPPTPQTISFASIPSHTACDAPFTFVLPSATSGLPVTLTVSGPATISGSTVTLTGTVGTVVLTATQAGNGTFSAAPVVVQNIAVTACVVPPTPQTISFASIPSHTACDAPFTFVLPSATSGLPVTLTVSGPATISGNTVTLTGAVGTVFLTATQAGNGTFSAASGVTQSFAVGVCSSAPQAITFSSVPDQGLCQGTITLNPTASSGLPVTLKVTKGSATISGNTVTFTDAGSVTVQATQAGNGSYSSAASVSQTFLVTAVPNITNDPLTAPATVGTPFKFTITGSGSPTGFTAFNLPPGLVLDPVTGVISGTPTAADKLKTTALIVANSSTSSPARPRTIGPTFVTLTCANGTCTSPPVDLMIVVAPAGIAPVIVNQSLNAVGTLGAPFGFAILATNSPTSFTASGLPAGLTLNPVTGVVSGTPAAAGTSVVVLNSTNATGSGTALMTIVISPAPSSRIVNFSARAVSGPGGQALIMGFVVSGSGKGLLVRGIGPTLSLFGVSNVLADPLLTLFGPAGVVATNDDWQTTIAGQPDGSLLAATAARVGAFALPSGSKDAALLTTVNTGAFSASLLRPNGTTGAALTEVYDTDTVLGARLINVSARVNVSTGEGTLIAGFVIAGNAPKTVLIRAVGPTLSVFGVADLLADPTIALMSGGTQIATNDNWEVGASTAAQIAAAATQVGAFALPAGSKDAALLSTLQPGSYTVLVTGVGNTTGVALIEIYDIGP